MQNLSQRIKLAEADAERAAAELKRREAAVHDAKADALEAEAGAAPPADVDGAAACRHFNCSEDTLARRRADGMPAIRRGSRWRYDLSACEQWFASRADARDVHPQIAGVVRLTRKAAP